ncbi:MAG: FHA domain-containing protein [Actinomycetota bacterium]|nr:FHA domain-containing protein [Actinomycetota bacterium]
MSRGLLEVLRFFLLALVWLFVAYALRTTVAELRRGRVLRLARAGGAEAGGGVANPLVARPSARLRVLEPAEQRGQVIPLTSELTVGRAPSCAFVLTGDGFASSVHARVFPRDGEVWVEDLGSTNGTYVNEQRLDAPVRLRRGDRLRIGRTVLEVAR